ncbi:xylosidase : arabinofuranosidase [Thozetella sp. PMI_491]|nr:xylosidase : arabinofuranosidase [Thozetella sp. PMI_491]
MWEPALDHLSSLLRNYSNPILSGWHSDPSCTYVEELDSVFFCTTSTFLAFPGIPIYTSSDLINWKLASHALSRPSQVPGLAAATYQSDGIYASTIRYRNGTFYLATAFLSGYDLPQILVFTTTDPYDDAAWSDPLSVPVSYYGYDPDLFWDLHGQLYITYAAYGQTYNTEIMQAEVDLQTLTTGNWSTIWTGSGGEWPEGPHIYLKDGLYYLVIAEGGTGLNHSVTIARAPTATGPKTDSYFQTVGHADLFQDKAGNWWGVALATRSGPAWETYPMGRETVLFPVDWEEDEWPYLQPVGGSMTGPLPVSIPGAAGAGPCSGGGEVVQFMPGSQIPANFLTWRPQPEYIFTISPDSHPNMLRILPSRANLTGGNTFTPDQDTLAFIGRLQTSTLFTYSLDISFHPVREDEEAGITLFLTQFQHIDLGIPHFRFRVEASGAQGVEAPNTTVTPIPHTWLCHSIKLRISAQDDTSFVLSAGSVRNLDLEMELGRASAKIVSGGEGKFTGSILGTYTTTNGGNGTTPSYVANVDFQPFAQEIDAGFYVRSMTSHGLLGDPY